MPWYALRSKPNKEDALWYQIRGHGHEAYYPRLRVRPVNPRARCVRPYFPGYLFVQVILAQVGTRAFARLPYAQGLVSFGGDPAEVPEVLIAAIRTRVDEINECGGEGFDAFGLPLPRLQAGDRVVINDGPFRGYQAIFDAHLAGTDRVRVLLQLLQARPMKLDLPAANVQLTKRH